MTSTSEAFSTAAGALRHGDTIVGLSEVLQVVNAIEDQAPYHVLSVQPRDGRYVIDVEWVNDRSEPAPHPYPAVQWAGILSGATGVHVEAESDFVLAVPVALRR